MRPCFVACRNEMAVSHQQRCLQSMRSLPVIRYWRPTRCWRRMIRRMIRRCDRVCVRRPIRVGGDARKRFCLETKSVSQFLRVCPSLSEVEDVPLKALCKTRILLVGFGYNQTNLESLRKLTACSWAGSGRCRGNEARSDHDFAVSLAIPCIRNML